MEKTAKQIFEKLNAEVLSQSGNIVFTLGNTAVTIKAKDIIGNSIQSWLGQWLVNNDIYCDEPSNTQEFPDFYLSEANKHSNFLEVKAFNYDATPAFDIANFDSYCRSLETKPYRLDADYIVFGYEMADGIITIKKIWLKKIWEIAGKSTKFALNTQVKQDIIYNIRPYNFKNDKAAIFGNKEEFLKAIYLTIEKYHSTEKAVSWKQQVCASYLAHYRKPLTF